MENFFIRYKNPLVLMAVLFIQVVALATQVKREGPHGSANSGGTRLIRVWTVTAITPFERAVVSTGRFFRRNWSNYIDLHNARKENQELHEEIARLKLEQIRYRQDAEQAQRLQVLLGFKQNYIGQIMAAQVIGTSGMEQSRMITIDKGSNSGVKIDMAVITPDGIVGKVKDVSPLSSQVLLVNDRDSGAGVILQGSRLQGILRGTPQGELRVADVMADESIQVGEQVITSGGDRIYPKGVPVGAVSSVAPDHDNDPFLAIKVKPAADLSRLEEVLIVMTRADELPSLAGTTQRAADLLAQRLPGLNKVDPASKEAAAKAGAAKPGASPSTGTAVPLSAKPSTTPTPAANNAPASIVNKPAAAAASPSPTPVKKPAVKTSGAATNSEVPASAMASGASTASPSPTPDKKPAVKTSGAATSPEVPAGAVASGASTGVPGATPKPKPVVKKPKPQATPTPAGTDQPASKSPDNQTPDGQNPAPAAEKPPR